VFIISSPERQAGACQGGWLGGELHDYRSLLPSVAAVVAVAELSSKLCVQYMTAIKRNQTFFNKNR